MAPRYVDAFFPNFDDVERPFETASKMPNVVVLNATNRRNRSMEQITTIGLDLAKSVFQVHAVGAKGDVVVRRAFRRSQILTFFEQVPPCLVGMEACASSHYCAREIEPFGHTVRMMPPAYVKAYVKRNKTDAADAEAICEAVTRPSMRFVPIKTVDQQGARMMLRARELLVRQRSQAVNALRAHMAEMGIIAAPGMGNVTKLIAAIRDESDDRVPSVARFALNELAEQIRMRDTRIERLDRCILAMVKKDADTRRLTSIPGVGPLIAATVRAVVQDPGSFWTGRDFAAWIGLTPRANSSGGKQRLGSISKRGNRQLRTLLIVGATSVLKRARRGLPLPQWIEGIMQRRPFKVVAVALANKIARMIWALPVKGGTYQSPTVMAKA